MEEAQRALRDMKNGHNQNMVKLQLKFLVDIIMFPRMKTIDCIK